MRAPAILKKASDVLDRIALKAVIALIIAMIATISLQILSRTLSQAYTWTEELSRYLLVWSTFLGATLAYKRGLHISVTLFLDLFPGRVRSAAVVAGTLLSMLFFAVIAWYGFSLMAMQIFQVSPALQLPMRWIYLVIPMAALVMLVHAASFIGGEVKK